MKAILLAMLPAWICSAQAPAPLKVEGGLLQGTSEDGLRGASRSQRPR